jgi:hypothetical protein
MLSEGAQRFGDLVTDIIEGFGKLATGLGAGAAGAIRNRGGDSAPPLSRSSDPMDRSMDSLRPSNSPVIAQAKDRDAGVQADGLGRDTEPKKISLKSANDIAFLKGLAMDDSRLYAANDELSPSEAELGLMAPPLAQLGKQQSLAVGRFA